MRCRTASRLMSLQLDHALGVEKLAHLSQHLEGCARCRETWAAMQAANSLFKEAPCLEAPPGLTQQVLDQLPVDRRAVVPSGFAWARASLAVMVALIVLVVGLAGVAVVVGIVPGQSDWTLVQQGGWSVIAAAWSSVLTLFSAFGDIASALWQGLRWPWVPVAVVVVAAAVFLWAWLWRRSGRLR